MCVAWVSGTVRGGLGLRVVGDPTWAGHQASIEALVAFVIQLER